MNAPLLLAAIFNGTWQGTLLCGAAYAVLRRARSWNASTLFTVWSILLAICVVLPFADYAFATRADTVWVEKTPVAAMHSVHQFVAPAVPAAVHPSVRVVAERAGLEFSIFARPLLLAIALLAALRLLLLARDLGGMIAARRAARRIQAPVTLARPVCRPYAFAASRSLTSPCVLGFLPALIVIPEALLEAGAAELRAIVLHEAEHVRRYDDVQNVLHRVVGAIGFFSPAVRIALRELALYREQICDDAAVDGLGDAGAYARALTDMAQWAQGRGVPVPSFIFTRKQLVRRLEMLLDSAVNHSLRVQRKFAFTAAAAGIVTAVLVLRLQMPVVAQGVIVAQASRPIVEHHATAARASSHHASPKAAVRPPPAATPTAAPAVSQQATRVIAPEKRKRVYSSASTYKITAAPYAVGYSRYAAAPTSPPAPKPRSEDLLDALNGAGLSHLSVDDLIALHDNGVSSRLIYAAQAYFGASVTAHMLVELADRGVAPEYLQSLSSVGLQGLAVGDVERLRDHGVTAQYIQRIRAYNPRASVDEIVRLRDSGF